MKKFLALFLVLAASTAFAGGDVKSANYNTGAVITVDTAVPTIAALPVNRLGSAASYTKTVDSTVTATALGDLPAGTNKVVLYSTGALNWNIGAAPDTALSNMWFASTTVTVFSGEEADLETLYFAPRSYPNDATATVRFWPFGK